LRAPSLIVCFDRKIKFYDQQHKKQKTNNNHSKNKKIIIKKQPQQQQLILALTHWKFLAPFVPVLNYLKQH